MAVPPTLPLASCLLFLTACGTVHDELPASAPQLSPAPTDSLRAFNSPIHEMAVSPDGDWLAVAGHFGTIHLYNARTLATAHAFELTWSGDHSMRVILTNTHLYAASTAGPARGWELASGERLFSVQPRNFQPDRFQLSADERILHIGRRARDDLTVDARTGEHLSSASIMRPSDSPMYSLEGWYSTGREVFRTPCPVPVLSLPAWRHGDWGIAESSAGELFVSDGSGRVLKWERDSLPCPAT